MIYFHDSPPFFSYLIIYDENEGVNNFCILHSNGIFKQEIIFLCESGK